MTTAWAFIPARSTSTRFPGKNVAPFLGEPLVVRAAKLALEARRLGLFDDVLVSIDDYYPVGATLDADPATKSAYTSRPAAARHPDARVIDVLRAHLEVEPRPDLICVLLPTSPLRTLRHLVESFRLLTEGVDVVLSVTPFRQDVRGAVVARKGLLLRVGDDLPAGQMLRHDGTVLWCRTAKILNGYGFYDGVVTPYLIPAEESADVDCPLDLEWAEFLERRRQSKSS